MSKISDFLASVKLTIVLLALMAATSIIGTVIPQHEPPQAYVQQFGEGTARIIMGLSLHDMYGAPWFILLMGFLGVNLLVCSIKRLPATLKGYRAAPRLTPGDFKNSSLRYEKVVNGLPSGFEEKVRTFLWRKMGAVTEKPFSEGTLFFAERGRWSRFGVYVVHLSVLVIFAGAIVGALFGFKGSVNIVEGQAVDYLYRNDAEEPTGLGFSVRCDKFSVSFYDSGAPREYRSDLTFIQDGKEVLTRSVRVNDPVTFGDITFYQASYGKTLGGDLAFELVNRQTGKSIDLKGSAGASFQLPDDQGTFIVIDYRPNLMNFGPAVKVHMQGGNSDRQTFWVFQKQPSFVNRPQSAYDFNLKSFNEVYYTGLQANRDPGVWLVYTGFCLIILGLIFSFFTSHRMVWVQIRKKGAKWQVIMAGSASKNRPAYGKTLEQWQQQLMEGIK